MEEVDVLDECMSEIGKISVITLFVEYSEIPDVVP